MTMTITLSFEAHAKVEQIPDFTQRLEHFIDEHYALEQWRKQQLKAVEATLSGDQGK